MAPTLPYVGVCVNVYTALCVLLPYEGFFFFFGQHQWWSTGCSGLLFELQQASVWFNRKLEESLPCSQIQTEGDYCNDLRGSLGVCTGRGVVPCWVKVPQPQTHRVRRSFTSQTSAQGAACPDLISDIFGDSSENWWKKNTELILVKIEGLAVHTHPQACRHTHTHTRIHILTHTL